MVPEIMALDMPRVKMLIADDVGLGKTIEAGLVVQEMILRHRVRSVLIICPSSLQVQWKEEMRDKFGLEFRIIDSESISLIKDSVMTVQNLYNKKTRLTGVPSGFKDLDDRTSGLQKSDLRELVVTDTIPLPKEKRIKKIKVLSVAKLLAEAISRIHQNQSVSSLFKTAEVEA